jgi:EAL domain-containing protein (putative c-di-GMP-specific phosphodiesterase class I)/CheY-like chemotaxis protein
VASTDPPVPGPPVLVADDDPSVRSLFTLLLEDAGLAVVAASDGEEALRQARTQRLSAVVLDSQMPGVDGITVLAELRARRETATVPVILVTGSTELSDRIRGLEAGADDYLSKPVHGDELVARVRAQLRGQAAWLREFGAQLRERATLTDRLSRLRPESSAVATASSFCREVADSDEGLSVAIVGFFNGWTLPLALCGDGTAELDPGRPLPRRTSEHLRRRVLEGAWTEQQQHQPAGALGVPLFNQRVTAAAYASLRGPDGPVGLLALARTSAGANVERDLSAGIDLAAIASTLLGPSLAHHYEISGRQSRLREVLREQAYVPFFQPIVDLSRDDAVGHEVLTRFDDGTAPERRFSEAVALGMGVEMEHATIATALEVATDLPDGTWLSINVSPTLLLGDPRLGELLADSQRPIVLELTEHDRIVDYPAVRQAVEGLGPDVRLSVDDAGSGYACLHHVLALEPDFVKLDRRWVHGIERDPARQALVAGLAYFARQTDSTLIAEGIEDPAELATLTELDVTLGQGFLLGRPAPLA